MSTGAARLKRWVYLLHRWVSIFTCVLVAPWLVSGMVMLFIGYPKPLADQRLARLPSLSALVAAGPCCATLQQAVAALPGGVRPTSLTLTSVAGQAVYRITDVGRRVWLVSAVTARLVQVSPARVLQSARDAVPGARAALVGSLQEDRWTHSGQLDAHRPLFVVEMDDPDRTRLYVSSSTGEVVMTATRAQRAWNLLGAWLHWLYMFREGSTDVVWAWLVIVLSLVATVGAMAGVCVGVWRWRFQGRYRSGRKTPYAEGWMRWHHVGGLLFGVLLVAWLFSGLMSMNPWHVFDPARPAPALGSAWPVAKAVHAEPIEAPRAVALLQRAGFEARELAWRTLGEEAFVVATDDRGGKRLVRNTAQGPAVSSGFAADSLVAALQLASGERVASADVVSSYDAYYYKRGESSMYGDESRPLPALKLVLADPSATVMYVDLGTGDLLLSMDRRQRVGRWLFNLLHSWDWQPLLALAVPRLLVMVACSIGALLIATTGIVLAVRRVRVVTRKRRRS